MKNLLRRNIFLAILLNVGLFAAVLFFLHPCLNTDPEIYFLYTLSGGYGDAPSTLLHYSYGWHPLLGSIIVSLFKNFGQINWYSAFLLIFHFICCITLFTAFLRFFNRPLAFLAFIIFFLFVETRLLLGFNYSTAALTATISGGISLLVHFARKKKGQTIFTGEFFFFSILILVAGLIRIHYVILFGAFSLWIAYSILSGKTVISYLIVMATLGLILLIAYQGQRLYYEKKIPGWKQEERLQKAYSYIANHARKTSTGSDSISKDKWKDDLIEIFFIYDRGLVNAETVEKYGQEHVRVFNFSSENRLAFYWLFMDLRVYLFLLIAPIIALAITGNLKRLLPYFYNLLLLSAGLLLFCMFFKMTEVTLMAFVALMLLSAFFSAVKIPFQKNTIVILWAIMLLSAAWMLIRLVKADDKNKKDILSAHRLIDEFNKHPDKLFVDAGSFPDLRLSIWDLPQQYPLQNFIYNELAVSNSYHGQLRKFGITDLAKEIPLRESIYLVGETPSILVQYYKMAYDRPVSVRQIPDFKYLNVYQIVSDSTK